MENITICDYVDSHQEQAEVKGRGRGRKQSVPFPLWSVTSEIQKETQLSELPPGSSLNSLIAQLGSLEQEVEALAAARGWGGGDDLWRHSGLYAGKSCWVPSEQAFKVLGEFSKLVLLKTSSVVLGRYSLSCGSAWPCGRLWTRRPVYFLECPEKTASSISLFSGWFVLSPLPPHNHF